MGGTYWTKLRRLMHSQIVRVMNTKYVNQIMHDVISNNLEPELNEIISNPTNKENLWFCRKNLCLLTFNIIFHANFKCNANYDSDKLCLELATDLSDFLGYDIIKRQALKLILPWFLYWLVPESYMDPYHTITKRINDNIKMLIKQKNEGLKEKGDNVSFMDNTSDMVGDKDLDFKYTETEQISDVFLMFLAGTDTTSLSLEWGLICLSKQPEIQNRVRCELEMVLRQNDIDYAANSSKIVYDIKLLIQLPLFRALLWEILRISCVSRLGLPHAITERDEWIEMSDGRKYRLPKGASLNYNVECIHYNYLENEQWKNKQNGLILQEICLENWLKEKRVIMGYLLLNYSFELPAKYEKMRYIPHCGGVRHGVCKPKEEIPIIIKKIIK